MLREAARCLRPGGVIRLVTPDIRHHIELYIAGVVPAETPAGKHYSSMDLTVEHPLDLVRIPIGAFGPHTGYVYDFATLKAERQAAGFRDVVRCPLGVGQHRDLAGMAHRGVAGDSQLNPAI